MDSIYPPEWSEEAFPIPGLDDGTMTPELLTEAFGQMDGDSKGHLIKADVRRLLVVIGEPFDERDVDEMMRMLDPEAKGRIDLPTFVEGFMNPGTLFYNAEMTTPDGRRKIAVDWDDLVESARERKELFIDLTGGREYLEAAEVKIIVDRFIEFFGNQKRVDYSEFLGGLDMEDCYAARNVFSVLERGGEVDIRQFLIALSQFSDANREDRVKFAFQLYEEETGFIGTEELYRIVEATAPLWAEREWISKKLRELAVDADISEEEFILLADKFPNLIAPSLVQYGT